MRRQARQWALMMLYSMDMAQASSLRVTGTFFKSFGTGQPIDPPESWDRHPAFCVRLDQDRNGEAQKFAESLVEGVAENRQEVDAAIQDASTKWRLDRMAALDRNVLRLATYEILHRAHDVPRKVAINEAVELAKTFGTSESGAFVNGILDRIGSA